MSAFDCRDRVERREVVRHRQAARRRDLEERVAEVPLVRKARARERGVERAVAVEHVDIAPGVGRRAGAGHPDPPRDPFGVTLSTLDRVSVPAS